MNKQLDKQKQKPISVRIWNDWQFLNGIQLGQNLHGQSYVDSERQVMQLLELIFWAPH